MDRENRRKEKGTMVTATKRKETMIGLDGPVKSMDSKSKKKKRRERRKENG